MEKELPPEVIQENNENEKDKKVVKNIIIKKKVKPPITEEKLEMINKKKQEGQLKKLEKNKEKEKNKEQKKPRNNPTIAKKYNFRALSNADIELMDSGLKEAGNDRFGPPTQ